MKNKKVDFKKLKNPEFLGFFPVIVIQPENYLIITIILLKMLILIY